MGNFNNLYCAEVVDSAGTPLPIQWGHGIECRIHEGLAGCTLTKGANQDAKGNVSLSLAAATVADLGVESQELVCPQLPSTSPARLARDRRTNKSYSHADPPASWTCPPDVYYELGRGVLNPSCNCGCGVIDPDCGYQLPSCDDQVWNPPYTKLRCGGQDVAPDLMYCRLESAR